MLKITLARHAETLWNEQLRYIGRTDLALSPLGQKNAGLLAAFLSEEAIDAIFASDMVRAVETATAVAVTHGLDVHREPLLNEIDFGRWEGLTHSQIAEAYPELIDDWMADPFSALCPDGEPVPIFAERVLTGWSDLVKRCESAADHSTKKTQNILVVTHAGCIKIILGDALGLERDAWWRIYQEKGALNYLSVEDGRTNVLGVNDVGYRSQK